jgi:threonine/homoserine/homoserine lactone efflux protein
MTLSLYPAFFIFALIMVTTPGPANLLLMSSGAQHGLLKSLPFVAGVTVGKLFLTIGLGFGFLSLLNSNPIIINLIKIAGTGYICWLSYKIMFLNLKPTSNIDSESKVPSFFNGILVHPLNPKGWAMVIAAYTQFTSFGSTSSTSNWTLEVLIIASTFFLIQSVSHSVWCWAGSLIFNFLSQKNFLRQSIVFILAILTVGTVIYSNFFI